MKHKNIFESLATALAGLMFAVRHQKNIRYLLVIAAVVIAATPFLGLSAPEAMVLCLTISLVIIAELVNSGIEYTVDLVTEDHHHLAKAAKDVAAAAVFIACVNAVVIATVFIFSRIR